MTLGFRPVQRASQLRRRLSQRSTRQAGSAALQCPSDRDLLDAVSTGSQAALRELFRRHGGAVHRLARLYVPDDHEADRIVVDVFVTLSHRCGRLEDDVTNVRLGLLAMARRRSRPAADAAAISPLLCLPGGDREAVALTVLATARLTDVALVLQADRRAVGSRLRAGLRSAAAVGGPPGRR